MMGKYLLILAGLFFVMAPAQAHRCCLGHGGVSHCGPKTHRLICRDGSIAWPCKCVRLSKKKPSYKKKHIYIYPKPKKIIKEKIYVIR
jgi:hypothetical protein